jgi:hypothetical protein
VSVKSDKNLPQYFANNTEGSSGCNQITDRNCLRCVVAVSYFTLGATNETILSLRQSSSS